MTTLKEYIGEQMQDPEFREEWERLQPERELMRVLVDVRQEKGLTQKEIAERTGIAQSEISKIENGTRNPSIKLLQKLADGLGMNLKIEFTPKAS